ncbi:MAG: Atg14 domain-containing protein [Anaeromicrobium sp.]|jgi:peptidoglycan hydrolase CwlO-like protein|uniref:hypothetical protein n=1 Tax=Anaeromicrobium sp. TaxID=1929132 RepID=UPI0025EE2063|nr:hypothetical protein [Anaeromicrobium sp.]MCT4593698.1 Atg14 domain-containing protein [Anaeromicrobium sp.]
MKKIVTALLVGTLLIVSAVPAFATEDRKERGKVKEQLSTEIQKMKEIRKESKDIREHMKAEKSRIKELKGSFKDNEDKKAEIKEERSKLKSLKEEIRAIREEIKTLREGLKTAKKNKDVEGAKSILNEIAAKREAKLGKLKEALEILKGIK